MNAIACAIMVYTAQKFNWPHVWVFFWSLLCMVECFFVITVKN